MLMAEDEDTDGVVEAAQALERAEAEAQTAVELAAAQAGGTDIVAREGASPEIVRARMTELRNDAMRKQHAVEVARQRLRDEMEARMHGAREVMRPLEEMIKALNEGLETVSLYLGRGEEISLLRDGESASAQEPITLRQMLLFMDEECAVGAEEGGIKPTDADAFDQWLLSDPAHLDQVLPERKGIVALRPRRRLPEYHSGAEAEAMREANRRTYWLIRNGERVYRTLTDLYVEERILPYSDEFERLFSRRSKGRVVPLRPGSHEWERAQEAAEDTERQYMRVGLILEGLLHRTPIFHPLPSQGVSFLDPASVRDGRVRYITDAEALLTTGKESFEQWRRRLAGELRVGMRVILGPGLAQEAFENRRGNKRLWPPTAGLPEVEGIYPIEERNKGGELVFRYRESEPRWMNDGSWGGGEYRVPKNRVTCRVRERDEFVLPFDLATVEEMEGFLRSRESRHSYVEMWPILKAAIAAKRREAQVEAPFRTMLVGVIAREAQVEVVEAEEAVDDLITWWKTKNKHHRPLLLAAARPEAPDPPEEASSPGGRPLRSESARLEEQERVLAQERAEREAAAEVERGALAVRMIVAEFGRRRAAARRAADPEVVAALKREHPSYLLIARLRNSGYLVLEAAEPTKDVYAHESEYTARGRLRERREWVLPGPVRPKAWIILAEHERWEGWELHADEREHLRGPEAEGFLESMIAAAKADKEALALAWDGERFTLWSQGSPASFDDAHPLTSDVDAPQVVERSRGWRRSARRTPAELRRWGHAHDQALRRGLPWEERQHRSPFDDGDDAGEQPLRHTVVWKDEGRIAALRADHDAYRAASRRQARMHTLVRSLLGAVQDEWLRRAWAQERVRFDEEFGDPELWEAHRQSKERHVTFPLSKEIEGSRWGRPDRLEDALDWLVESGTDPNGWTVEQILTTATERFGEQAGEAAKEGDGDDEDEAGAFAFQAPEEILGYALVVEDEEDDDEEDWDES